MTPEVIAAIITTAGAILSTIITASASVWIAIHTTEEHVSMRSTRGAMRIVRYLVWSMAMPIGISTILIIAGVVLLLLA